MTRLHLHRAPATLDWSAVQAGDPAALEVLFAEWLPVILQWCRRLGGPRVDADHAAQDVALVVLSKLHTVHGPEVLPSWLFGVTRRVLAQHRRRAWVKRWIPGVDVDRTLASSNPEADLGRQELLSAVRDAVDALPASLREVVVLCDLERRPQAEVAEIVGLPLGTVKSRLRRARGILARILEARGLAPGAPSTEEEA